jgi:hypothetical protein
LIVGALALGGIYYVTAGQAQQLPLPKYYGVFAVQGGRLIELRRNPSSDMLYTAIGGADVIQNLSGISFPDGNIRFIVFSPQVAGLGAGGVRVNYLSRIENAPPPAFHLSTWGWDLHIAPIPNQSQMVEFVSNYPLRAKHLALIYNGVYDFEVPNAPDDSHDCVRRLLSIMGADYQPC